MLVLNLIENYEGLIHLEMAKAKTTNSNFQVKSFELW